MKCDLNVYLKTSIKSNNVSYTHNSNNSMRRMQWRFTSRNYRHIISGSTSLSLGHLLAITVLWIKVLEYTRQLKSK